MPTRIKKVAAPSISRSHTIEKYRVDKYGGWRYDIGSGDVFIEGQVGAECADGTHGRETGVDNTTTKVSEAIAHLLVRLLSFGVKYEAGGEAWPV
jgi:hypothetical protein